MAIAYEVRLYERCSGDVIATYLGIAPSRNEAMVNCVRRAPRTKLTHAEAGALVNKIRYGVVSQQVDTLKWAFSVQSDQTISL